MINDLIKLVNAGFTKNEIMELMKAEKPEPKTEPKKEPDPEPQKEPQKEQNQEQDPITALRAEISSLREEIHLTNVNNSKQPENVQTVDDILMKAMKGGNE